MTFLWRLRLQTAMAALPLVVYLVLMGFVQRNVNDPKLSMRVGDVGLSLAFALALGLYVWIAVRHAHVLQRGGWRLCPGCGEAFSGEGPTQCGGCGRIFEGRLVRQRWRKWLMRGYACSLAEPFGVLIFGIISSLHVVELYFGKEANGAEPGVARIVAVAVLLSFTVIAAAWMLKVALERRRRVRAARFCVCEQCGYPYAGEGEITCTECGDVFNGAEVRMRWLERVT
ncbi:MAG: hypothetical protein IBJ18_05680 [Phycisphaerales bacterium]|nr:hypothetical protein [Phycisphaerales bacterium]